MLVEKAVRRLVGRRACLPVLRHYASSPPSNKQNEHKEDYDGTYTPDKDPMAHMSEEEKNKIRKDVMEQGRRAYSIGYGIIGGGAAATLLIILYANQKKR
ncbi:hypothetical protein HDU97_003528 [Phlyctochytrium planicorne]|nr:hypothetical protein HDU97_003528 [Phlyctochytrium planicorne]